MELDKGSDYHTLRSCTVFMPAFDEAQTIREAVYEAHEVLKETTPDFDIVVVNDGSRDETGAILQDLCVEIAELRVITHEKNQGIGRAFQSAFNMVRTDLLFFNSADLQGRMSILQDFLPLLDQYDIVVGALKKRKDPLWRVCISRFYALCIRLFLGIHLQNINTLKLINCQVLKEVQIESDNAFCDAELLFKAKVAGYRIGQHPIDHFPRPAGKQKGANPSTVIKTALQGLIFVLRLKFSKYQKREHPGCQ